MQMFVFGQNQFGIWPVTLRRCGSDISKRNKAFIGTVLITIIFNRILYAVYIEFIIATHSKAEL